MAFSNQSNEPQRIKVVHIITRLDFGGAQLNTLYTAVHLDPKRFEVVLMCGRGGVLDDIELPKLPPEVRVRFVPDLVHEIHPLKDVIAFLQLVSILESERPDLVHTHSSKAGILGRLAARLAGVPGIVHTFHGFSFYQDLHYMHRWRWDLYVGLERMAARLAHRLIFVSVSNRRDAEKLGIGDPGRYELIHSGIKLGDYPAKIASKEKQKAALGVRMHQPLVVSVGNLKPQKNPEHFLLMAREALKQFPEANFLFVGNGMERSRVHAMILRYNLSRNVFFVGWRRDVPQILAAADVFVLTSLWEGLPRSLVEAMRSRLPCACYASDGVRDLIIDGKNGFLVEKKDWRLLSERVASLLGSAELRKSLGAAAAAAIGPEFDIDGMVKDQETLYDKVLAGRAQSPAPIHA